MSVANEPVSNPEEGNSTGPAAGSGANAAATLEMKLVAMRSVTFEKILIPTVVVNGFVAILLFVIFFVPAAHDAVEGLVAFVILFGLGGIALAVLSARAFLRTFEPRMHLRLTPGTLKPGGEYVIEWESKGGRRPFSQLRITLECREEVICPNGGTLTEECYRIEWLNTEKPEELARGTRRVKVPEGLMHSMDTRGGSQVVWLVRAKGAVRGWPGTDDEYPVVMLPELWEKTA